MKKITLLLLFLFFSVIGYSQLNSQGFETPGAIGPLPSPWDLGSPEGDWAVFDNGVGTAQSWGINTVVATPHGGVNFASVSREQIGAGNTSEDYLATPMVHINDTGSTELHFWNRMFTSGNQGTIYRVMIAPAVDATFQTNPGAYSTVQEWTELNLITPTTNFNVWTEMTVDLSAYHGFDVYIAFVKVYTQPTGTLDGDRWLIDDVGIYPQCTAPVTSPTPAATVTFDSADLYWTNPGNATSFQVTLSPPPLVGTNPISFPVNGTGPYHVTGLAPNTQYTYTVVGICPGSGFTSPPSLASAPFTTQTAPPVCGGNLVDSGGIAGNYSNNENTSTTVTPTAGNVATITFTAFNTQAGDTLTIYNGPNTSSPVLAVLSGATLPGSYTSTAPGGELTFVFTSNATGVSTGYAASITCGPAPDCRIPHAVLASGTTTTGTTITWTQPTNPDSSTASVFDVIALPQGSPAPNGASVPTFNDITPAAGPSFTLTGLTPATCYDIYVRAVCAANSGWSIIPTTVCTLVAPPVCGGNYVDTGGTGGNYPNGVTQPILICPGSTTDAVTLTFTSFNVAAGDTLQIYDGNDANATLLATLSGTTLPPSFTSSAASGCLYAVFTSNATGNAAGWIANVICAPKPTCTAPTVFTSSAVLHNSVTLNWTQPANPDSSVPNQWNVYAVPCGSPAPTAASTPTQTFNAPPAPPYVLNTGLSPLTCYDIYVRASCGSAIVGPITITTLAAPPECGGNFVDAGGTTAAYAANSNITTVICPTTPGEVVTVTFTAFNTEATWDALYVYNGNSVVPANMFASNNGPGNVPGGLAGGYWGQVIPCPFTSSDANGCLTFVFRSDGSVQNPGWVANVTCGPPPTCSIPTGIAASAITFNSVTLNWTQPANPDTTTASAWQVLALPCGSPAPAANATGFIDVTNAPPFVLNTGLTPATCYDIYVRANCGTSVSNWPCAPTTITTLAAPPICGGNFVDEGGTGAPYAANSNVTTTICPTTPGEIVTVTFTSFNTEATWDALYVYNGNAVVPANLIPSTNPPGNVPGGLAGGYWGTLIPCAFTSASADGCLTFVFRSDGSVQNAGWVANITCGPPASCAVPAGLVASNVRHNQVDLNWTQPANADTSVANAWQVLALPCGSPAPTAASTGYVSINQPPVAPPYTLTGLTPATCYDLYIRANCGTTTSAWTCAPVTITTLVTPPTCNEVFTDSGGATGAYGNNANIPTYICPQSPGDVVTVTFTSFNTEATVDGLYVYDGNTIGVNQLASTNGAGTVPGGIAGAYWGNLVGGALPGPFTSSTADGCLTFVFRSNGFTTAAGWVANVTCAPAPTCARPLAIVAVPAQLTQTSATINWVQPANPNGSVANQWQVIWLPAGSAPPGPGAVGTTVTGTATYTITGLTAGTTYDFYVRAICGPGDNSIWSPYTFSTPPNNDECINASFAIVNQNLNCVQTTHGTLIGATASSPATTCGGAGAANDDVWFTFTATAATHIISFNNVTPGTTINYAIYSGTCAGLTEVGCNSGANLVAGTTYLIRVFSVGTNPTQASFDMCIGTLPCTEAPAFCTGQTVTYANSTNVPSLGQIGCLFTSPNPAFFFLQVNNAGPLSYLISQVDTNGTPRDVDYVAWGPFTDLNTACSGVPQNPLGQTVPIPTPATGCPGTLHACSYSIAPQEIMCIPNAQLCEVYVIMITNFSNAAGTVTFTQTNNGGGTTACFPINTFNYPQTYYCQNQPNPTPVLAPSATAGTYSSTTGLVFADSGTNTGSASGTIDLLASTPGAYIVTSTTATTIGGTCSTIPFITTTRTVIITAPANATIAYANPSYCNTSTGTEPVIHTGTNGGFYSASPAGLIINGNTGEIVPGASNGGTYTVTYTVPAIGGCPAFTTTTQVVIIDAPVPTFTQVAPICPGDALAPLPTSSEDATPITGTWSPAINNQQTTTYTFTPDAGQCAETTFMTINVGSTIPTFDPVAAICPGAPLAALPTTSLNGIDGIWSPALDNTQTTTYTFTPTSGVCVGTTTLTIQVLTPNVTPTFNAIAPICPNGVLNPLPTTSLNGITGTWSPALDNTQTTTYTFTPDPGQCGVTTTTTVVVNPPLVVTVNNPTFCPGSSATIVATPSIPGTYTYTWTVPQGVPNPGNVDSFVTSVPGPYTVTIDQVNSFCNTDFETPLATGTTPNLVNENLVPCWDTTASDNIIEIWPPGFEGVTAYSGNQLIELNANLVSTLFQDFTVIPGTTISVSFAHRGRQGTDVCAVEIGPVGGPYTSLGNFSDGNTAWGLHSVNYTVPTGNGNNYTLRFVSVSSTGGSQSIGNLLDSISISSLSCTSAPATGIASYQTLPAPTVTVTQPTCTVQTGTIEVTSPLNIAGGLPTNLFISEVTDSNAGALTYVEIYNATGAPVDLSNYKLRTFNNGSATVTGVCNNTLSGILANNSTHVVAVGSATNQGGVTPDEVFASCTGVNNDDNIRLSTIADVDIDIWGMTDGTSFTPANQAGYTFRRNNTAVVPSTTFNAADWTALDPEDYSNVGSYALASATYEYSLDSGTYQAGTTFSGVAPGPHTITVHNLETGCYSLPFDVTVDPVVGSIPTVTTITYTTPVCQNSATPELPDTSAAGFTPGGTYSEVTSTGLSINATTGEINLSGSTVGFHTVQYEVLFDPVTCQAAGVSTFVVEIKAVITPLVGFSYTSPICKLVGGTLSPSLNPGFTLGGTFSSTTGLSINGSTGVIDVANSTVGTYTVTYTVAADAANCQLAGSGTATIQITPGVAPGTDFSYNSPYCSTDAPTTELPTLGAGFTTGGTFTATGGLTINPTTGEINTGSTPGTYTITYTVNADPSICQLAGTGTTQITIIPPILVELNGGCQSVYVLNVAPVNGSFNPETASFSWQNAAGVEVGTSQSLNVPAVGTYTVTVTVDGCATESAPFNVTTIACQIQKGISVNNDGFNDVFDLTGFDVKKLTIFNRYGMEVYSKANYVNEWGGKSDKGDELPDGTYFYVIDKNVGDSITGWIYINRAQ